jgi:hypothetical protein
VYTPFSTTHCARLAPVGGSRLLWGKQSVTPLQRFSLASITSALKRRLCSHSFLMRSSRSRNSRQSGFKSTDFCRGISKPAVLGPRALYPLDLFRRTQCSISSGNATTGLRLLSEIRRTGSPIRSHLRALLEVRCKHSAISFHPFRILIGTSSPHHCPLLSVYSRWTTGLWLVCISTGNTNRIQHRVTVSISGGFRICFDQYVFRNGIYCVLTATDGSSPPIRYTDDKSRILIV